jgi:hypothetical protein
MTTKVAGECLAVAAEASTQEDGFDRFEADEECEDGDVKRPDAPDTPDNKATSIFPIRQPARICVTYDKATQHKEEVYEDPGIAQKPEIVEVTVNIQVENRDQYGTDAAPTIQTLKTRRNRWHARNERTNFPRLFLRGLSQASAQNADVR